MSGARATWSTGGAPVTVEVPAALGAALAELFPDDRVDAVAGEPELAMIEAGAGYRLVELGPDEHTRTRAGGTPGAVLAALELSLAERLALSRPTLRTLHAGGVVGTRGALLLPGNGGSGKSTLTVALARTGLPVLGDDAVLLDGSTGAVHAFRRLLKLLPASCSALGLDPPDGPLARLWPDASFFHPRQLGSGWAEGAPVAAVVFPTWDPKADAPALRPVPGGEAMRRLLGQLLLPPGGGAADFDLLARAVGDAPTAELRYGNAAEAVPVLRELVAD